MTKSYHKILNCALVTFFFASILSTDVVLAQTDTTRTDTLSTPALAESLEESMLIKGTISQQLNEHDKAIEMFLLGLEKNKESAPLLLGLSESYLALQDFNSALFYVDEALGVDNVNPILVAHKMSIYSTQKDLDKLRELIAKAESENIESQDIDDFRFLMKEGLGSEDARRSNGTGDSENNSQDTSIDSADLISSILSKITENASSLSPEANSETIEDFIDQSELENATKEYLKGRLAYSNDEFSAALALFELSISEDPKNVSSWAFLIKAASSNGDVGKASTFTDQADLLFPYQMEIELANIHRLIASNELEEATNKLQAIEVDAEWEPEKNLLRAKLEALLKDE